MDEHPEDCDCADCRYLAGDDPTDDGQDDRFDDDEEDDGWTYR